MPKLGVVSVSSTQLENSNLSSREDVTGRIKA